MGPARKDSVDVGYRRADSAPTACVIMSLKTSHIQIKVTQPGLCEVQASMREGAAEMQGKCQSRFALLSFDFMSQNTNCADRSSKALIRF